MFRHRLWGVLVVCAIILTNMAGVRPFTFHAVHAQSTAIDTPILAWARAEVDPPFVNVDGDIVYVKEAPAGSGADNVISFDLRTGVELGRWSWNAPFVDSRSVIRLDSMFIGQDREGVTVGVDISTGEQQFEQMTDTWLDIPQLAGDLAITLEFTMYESKLVAYDAATWTERWWESTGGGVSDFIAAGSQVFLSRDNEVRAFDVATGRLLWTTSLLSDAVLGGPGFLYTASLSVMGRHLIVKSAPGVVSVLDSSTGQLLWDWLDPNMLENEVDEFSKVAVSSNAVYNPANGQLVALEIETGEQMWSVPTVETEVASPILTGDQVVMTTDAAERRFSSFDAMSGDPRWSITLLDEVVEGWTGASGVLLVRDHSNTLVAISDATALTTASPCDGVDSWRDAVAPIGAKAFEQIDSLTTEVSNSSDYDDIDVDLVGSVADELSTIGEEIGASNPPMIATQLQSFFVAHVEYFEAVSRALVEAVNTGATGTFENLVEQGEPEYELAASTVNLVCPSEEGYDLIQSSSDDSTSDNEGEASTSSVQNDTWNYYDFFLLSYDPDEWSVSEMDTGLYVADGNGNYLELINMDGLADSLESCLDYVRTKYDTFLAMEFPPDSEESASADNYVSTTVFYPDGSIPILTHYECRANDSATRFVGIAHIVFEFDDYDDLVAERNGLLDGLTIS